MDIYFEDQGPRSGLPVVLIHGFPFDHSMWEPQVQALKDRYRVVVYDVRGLGRTPAGAAPPSMEGFVDDLLILLDLLGLPAAVLCGLSMGGYIALQAALRVPRRIQGLVLADTRSQADTEQGRRNRLDAIKGIEADGLQPFAEESLRKVFAPGTLARGLPCVDAIRRTILKSDPRGVCFASRAIMSRADTTALLPRIAAPALVLCGEHDGLTPPAVGEDMARAIPGGRFARVPDAGHLSSIENPRAFNRELLGFLNSLPQ
jgi:3-oxoadipate enol-lactonase